MSDEVRRLKEWMADELADIMLLALRKEAGMFLTSDEYYRRKDELMQITQRWVLP